MVDYRVSGMARWDGESFVGEELALLLKATQFASAAQASVSAWIVHACAQGSWRMSSLSASVFL